MALLSTIDSYRLAAGEGITDQWWKDGRVTAKATGAQTGGGFAQIETIDPRGTATPVHVHLDAEESFYVLEGEVSVFVEDERIEVAAGDYALVPRGTPHAYLVRSERARMLVTFSPAGFEEAFSDLGVPAAESPEPPADTVFPPPEEMARAFGAYSCEILGPPPAL
ncbi:MAG TPA: quercetin 2,3-dioxygenase [Solirubrobacteraceae bacterium]|nr:quercetin 2,3-dioxygenase [Solirubrobacteraceae bacterium]